MLLNSRLYTRDCLLVPALLLLLGASACGGDAATGKGSSNAVKDTNIGIDFAVSNDSDNPEADTAEPSADTSPVDPGTFGATCKSNEDCDSSLCVQNANGKICTQSCESSCPSGFSCAEKKTPGGDVIFLCLPRFLYLCDPCDFNSQCNDNGKSGNVCVSFGKAGSYCGIACDEVSPDCPNQYSCQQVVDAKTGLASSQCVREKGLCECSQRAVQLALATTCTNQNLYGACKGSRNCTSGGLSTCAAPVPKPEECNGLDDDCDGDVDNFDASATCKKTNKFGSCEGVIIACVKGKTTCDAPAAKPEKCNGIDDDCDGDTDEGLCDDGDPCTNDTCNTDGSCKHKKLAGMICDDGSLCTQTDKCLAGKCVGGNVLDCDDNDSCTTDSCDPFTGCVHKPASNAICPDDGIACTQDLCKKGNCVHPQKKDGTKCADDGKVCTQDTCKLGACAHIAKNGGACTDDGKVCTKDVCVKGACAHTPSSGTACEDGNPCTLKDICLSGSCKSGAFNQCDDKNPCTKDLCDPQVGCKHANNDFALCSAKSSDCPVGTCTGGGCFSKPNEPCSAEVKVNLCSKVTVLGTCAASGKCVAKSVPKSTGCGNTPCKSVCIKCSIFTICMDGIFGF